MSASNDTIIRRYEDKVEMLERETALMSEKAIHQCVPYCCIRFGCIARRQSLVPGETLLRLPMREDQIRQIPSGDSPLSIAYCYTVRHVRGKTRTCNRIPRKPLETLGSTRQSTGSPASFGAQTGLQIPVEILPD
jgi:hypothetical protein